MPSRQHPFPHFYRPNSSTPPVCIGALPWFFLFRLSVAADAAAAAAAASACCRAQLTDVFENLDHTADGFIREEDIRRALDKLDIVASDAQITYVLSYVKQENSSLYFFATRTVSVPQHV